MTVSATEATFEGFRVTRHNPGTILIWAGVWLVGLIAAIFATLPFIAPWIPELTTAAGDPNKLSPAALAGISNAGLAAAPVILLVQSVVSPAVYRAVLRPSAKGFGYLRLGRDELRMFVVVLGIGAVQLIFNLISAGLETVAAQTIGVIAGAMISFVLFLASIVISVRLSMVAPITLVRERISFAEGWRVSRGWFWPLLGITILSATLAVIVLILLFLIGWPLQTVVVAAAGTVSPLAMISSLLMLLLLPLGAALLSTIIWAPFAAMCRNLPPQA